MINCTDKGMVELKGSVTELRADLITILHALDVVITEKSNRFVANSFLHDCLDTALMNHDEKPDAIVKDKSETTDDGFEVEKILKDMVDALSASVNKLMNEVDDGK